jgi:NAD(P)-dependent dehydrogenase (short-subunit alcohol dehydrogenase family)
MVAVNLTGFFRLTQRVVPAMLSQQRGHIVNITTTLVDYASSEVPSVLVSLTKGGTRLGHPALAIEYATRGIRVNAVSPGVIATQLHADESYEGSAGLHPLGRVGTVGDIIGGILFLESAPFITGEILHIDGGQIADH